MPADPKNFDEIYNGDRAFVIGGQTFHWRPLHWREWGELIDREVDEQAEEAQERKRRIQELIDQGKPELDAEEEIDLQSRVVKTFEDLVDRASVYIEREEVEDFRRVLDDPNKRISLAQLNELNVWLREVQTPDRPTRESSASSPGPGTQGATSPAA